LGRGTQRYPQQLLQFPFYDIHVFVNRPLLLVGHILKKGASIRQRGTCDWCA